MRYIVFAFLLTANTLFPIPVDKLVLFLAVIYAAGIKGSKRPFITGKDILLCSLILVISIAGSVINVSFDPMQYYPIVGILFISTYKKNESIEYGLYYALLIQIVLTLFFYGFSYIEMNSFVRPMTDKGMPFLHSSLGLTSTNQIFGTYCVLWMIIYFNRKQHNLLKGIDKIWYICVVIAIVTTLNRATFLFFILVILFRDIRFFLFLMGCMGAFIIAFFQEISTFLLSSNTLSSRTELLEGFNKSYLESGNPLVYTFGKGAVFIDEQIALGTTYGSRTDIENGYAFLLHGYGIIGLFLYVTLGMILIISMLRKVMFYESAILFFYMFLALYFTQELVSNSFYVFMTYILYIAYYKKNDLRIFENKSYNLPKVQ